MDSRGERRRQGHARLGGEDGVPESPAGIALGGGEGEHRADREGEPCDAATVASPGRPRRRRSMTVQAGERERPDADRRRAGGPDGAERPARSRRPSSRRTTAALDLRDDADTARAVLLVARDRTRPAARAGAPNESPRGRVAAQTGYRELHSSAARYPLRGRKRHDRGLAAAASLGDGQQPATDGLLPPGPRDLASATACVRPGRRMPGCRGFSAASTGEGLSPAGLGGAERAPPRRRLRPAADAARRVRLGPRERVGAPRREPIGPLEGARLRGELPHAITVLDATVLRGRKRVSSAPGGSARPIRPRARSRRGRHRRGAPVAGAGAQRT